jgi:PAS domain S-box-containing protein
MLAFSRSADSRSTLPEALTAMAGEAAALLGAHRASIWLHDRRARELWLAACSEPAKADGRRIPAGGDAHAALGLTLDSPVQRPGPDGHTIIAPLRGWRRALGTLIFEGATSTDLTADQALELAHDVSHQLSTVIENLQLVEEVVRQHRLLKDSFNSLVDLVIVTDNALRIVQTNDALARCLGRRQEEMFQNGLEAVVGSELSEWVTDGAEAPASPAGLQATAGIARTRTFHGSPLGGTVVVTTTPLVSDGRDLVGRVIVARDVTQQVQLEAEREALRARLAQSEKLASLGQFVAGVAHEINNPLQGVLGYVELMLRSDKANPMRVELRRVMYEADRAAKIVRNLLVFSGSRRMARRRLALERVLSTAISSRRTALARSGIELVRHHRGDSPSVNGDPLLLQQAFLNVLINAEHAITDTGQPGTIEVSTETDTDRTRIIMRIRDTGPGIPSDVLPRIFDPFFTTKEVNRGTGLGLTIAYGIVQEHGGSIHAENVTSGGALFTIELPAAVKPARPRKRPLAKQPALAQPSKRARGRGRSVR